MKKYKITTAKNAVKNGLVKVGDEIWVKCKANECFNDSIYLETEENAIIYCEKTKIRIPIPEQKPIDFGEAGRVLKDLDSKDVIITTGYCFDGDLTFSGYILKSKHIANGFTSNNFSQKRNWKDITDTYKL